MIGGICIQLRLRTPGVRVPVERAYDSFATDQKIPDLSLDAWHGDIARVVYPSPAFDCGVWSLHIGTEETYIRMPGASWTDIPEFLAVLKRDYSRGQIWVDSGNWWESRFPLNRPLGEVIMVNLVTQRETGALFHASGIAYRGIGLLFAGASGAGKTTMSRLWLANSEATLLNDDRILIGRDRGRFWMHSTPWHGDERSVSPLTVPLERIFIIEHGDRNQIMNTTSNSAVADLVTRSFPTYWDLKGMRFALGFLEELVHSIPCHKLSFVPDPSAVSFLQCLLDS